MTPADKFTWSTYDTLLRLDFVSFAQRCFRELSPRTQFAMNWHIELIAAKLMALREGKIRRLIINMPPRYLKSLLASVAFPAWCLGHDPAAQIVCASYAQELADKLSRDCRRILASDWYRRIFPTRLSPERRVPPGIGRMNLLHLNVAADGTVEMPEADAAPLLRAGWVRVDAGDLAGTGSSGSR